MKRVQVRDGYAPLGRAPHGARGLKQRLRGLAPHVLRRAPHGARGLKRLGAPVAAAFERRAPHGARGLKPVPMKLLLSLSVAPRTGRAD